MGSRGAAEPFDRLARGLADRQWGVVARQQLLAAGVTRRVIDRRIATGALVPIHVGVYAVGHRVLTWRGRFLAASLACGPDAVVSHRSAGILHGFLPLSSSQAVDVSVPRRHRAQQGLILHHPRALASIDTTVKDAVPVAAPMRTLADLAALLGAVALERAVRQAERHRLLDVRALDAHLRAGRAGTARLRGVISGFDEGLITRSELEQRFYALTRAARLVRPLANVRSTASSSTPSGPSSVSSSRSTAGRTTAPQRVRARPGARRRAGAVRTARRAFHVASGRPRAGGRRGWAGAHPARPLAAARYPCFGGGPLMPLIDV